MLDRGRLYQPLRTQNGPRRERKMTPRIVVTTMSKLPTFEPVAARPTLATVVAMGVLLHRAGAGPDRDASRIRYGQALARRWAARALQLYEHGWALDPRRRSYLIHCPPALFVARGRLRPCNTPAICPHCWARAAIDRWRELDFLLFPPESLPGRRRQQPAAPAPRPERVVAGVLVRRTVRYGFPLAIGGKATLPLFFRNRLARAVHRRPDPAIPYVTRGQETRWLRAAGATGGVEQIHVEHAPATAEAPAGWVVEVRQFLVVSRADLERFLAAPMVAASPRAAVRLQPHAEVTRIRLAALVGGVFRYPRFLLNGSPAIVLAYLAAREGSLLSSRFGILRLSAATKQAFAGQLVARRVARETAREAARHNSQTTLGPAAPAPLPEDPDHDVRS